VRILVSPFRFAVCALGALCLFGAPAFSQQRLERGVETDTIHSDMTVNPANNSMTEHAKQPPQHAVHDWTHSHMLYPRVGSTANLIAAQKDPRAIQHWQEEDRKDHERWRWRSGEGFHTHHHNAAPFHRDWAISIGTGAQVDDAVYPAKWTFDINETVTAASCTSDYLVVPVDTTGIGPGATGLGQPDIVGLNNLYSGTSGTNGICNQTTGFSLSAAAAASGGNTVYTGTFSPTISVGATVTVAGFTNPTNNGTFTVQACTPTQLTLNNPSGVGEITAATAQITPAFPLSAAAAASGGNTVYTGTFSPTISVGATVTVTGFTNATNNGTFTVQVCTPTQLTLNNPSGVAETTAATVVTSDNGGSATVLFSYAIVADDGIVSTSPTTSLDGNLIAFVEEGTNSGIAQFNVLAWGTGAANGTNAADAQDALTNTSVISSGSPLFVSNAPVAGSGTVANVPLTVTLGPTTFPLSAAANADVSGNTAYTGTFSPTIPPGATVTVTGFTNATNNGTFTVQVCTPTQLTLNNPSGVAETTVASAQTTTPITIVGTDTFSSPFVDYTYDVAYVGNDNGVIFRIQNVFCPAWVPCNGAAPSLDPTWGTDGALVIGGTCTGGPPMSFVTGIVVDSATGNVFAGCADGNLYGFTPTGVAIAGSPLSVGDGSIPFGALVDPPVLDVVNGWAYVETASCSPTLSVVDCPGGLLPVLVQASTTNLGNFSVASLFPGTATNNGGFVLHAPAFNNAYFNGGTPLIYEYANDNTGETVLYGIAVTGTNNLMVSGTPGGGATVPPACPSPATTGCALPITGLTGAFEISPITELFSPGATEDRIFASPIGETAGNPTIVSFDVNAFPASSTPENFAVEGTGTSAIIVDNVSTANQANSVYFGTLGIGAGVTNPSSVVKLTQSGLN
jgi:hypothetical protein